jgi:hypothetical protein
MHPLVRRPALRICCTAVLTVAIALGACRNDPPAAQIEKPPAPNMQAVLDAYAMPTASLGADTLPALLAAVGDRTIAVDALQLDPRVIEAARAGIAQVQADATAHAQPQALVDSRTGARAAAQALTVEGDGYLVVTRICDGWGPLPVPDLANGFMELTVGFTERGVDPVVWGAVSLCRYRVGEHQVQIDGVEADPRLGDVRVFVGNDVALETFGAFPDPVVVDLAAQVFVDGREFAGRLSFRIDVLTRAFEVLVPLGAGHVVATVAPDRSSAVQVRAQNGTFTCDLAAMRCTAPSGETIGAP